LKVLTAFQKYILKNKLTGKKIVIVGGAGKIGKQISVLLGKCGATVILADLNKDIAEEVVKDIGKDGGDASYAYLDLREENSIKDFVNKIKLNFGEINILVNCARPPLNVCSLEESFKQWDLGLEILLKGPAQVSHYLSDIMPSGSSIINIGSTNSIYVSHQPLAYHVGKAGLLQMTRWLAVEFGKKGIRVNIISLGLIDIPDHKGKHLFDSDENLKIAELLVPIKQKASTCQDIVEAIIYLGTNRSDFLTGQEICLDGGISLKDHFHVLKQNFDLNKEM
jgi:NAD(P)-dependent dehydrogenase (short-subunit alcohol dehydrogenase family)